MGIKREKWLKQCLKRVYFIFPITSAISAPLKSVFNSCLVGLEPLAHKTVDPNRLKHSFALNPSAFQRNQIAWATCGLTRSLSPVCPGGGTPGKFLIPSPITSHQRCGFSFSKFDLNRCFQQINDINK